MTATKPVILIDILHNSALIEPGSDTAAKSRMNNKSLAVRSDLGAASAPVSLGMGGRRFNCMGKRKDVCGQRFNRWTVLSHDSIGGKLLCRCSCGVEKLMDRQNVVRGLSKSCGCWRRENSQTMHLKHGHSKRGHITSEIRTYRGMIKRCYCKEDKGYFRYGGRGITVCERWLAAFENFLADMGFKPSAEHSIERINNNEGYSPANCIWATATQQANNRRTNRKITFQGNTKSMSEWSRIVGYDPMTIKDRLNAGWSVEAALTKPLRKWPSQVAHREQGVLPL